MKLIFAVLDVSLTMGLTRCYKTECFLHLYTLTSSRSRLESYKRLVSVSGGKYLGLFSASSFYVSCPSLPTHSTKMQSFARENK